MPTTSAGKQLLDSFEDIRRKYRKRLNACRKSMSVEAVHDLRTGTRRLLSIVELLKAITTETKPDSLRRLLKAQLDGFDSLRDTQVMLEEVGSTVGDFSELAPFLLHLQHEERNLLQETGSLIKSLPSDKLRRKLDKAGRVCKNMAPTGRDITAMLLTAIDNAYATVLKRHRDLNPTNLDSIHHLRIAVKKFRYLLTATQPIFGFRTKHLAAIQDYLTLLGDIQNSSVLLATLQRFFVGGIPEAVDTYYRKQQQELLAVFMERRDEIFGFWQQNQDNGLPWELGSPDWNSG